MESQNPHLTIGRIELPRSWPAGSSDVEATPYDLAPTLAAQFGVTMPDATGKALSATAPKK